MAKVDGLHQSPRAPSFRRTLYFRPTKAGLVAAAYPLNRKRKLSPKQQEAVEAFREAAIIAKYAPAGDQMASRHLARGSQFLPRDLQYLAIFGRLCTLFFTNGERVYQMASRVDLSELLDILGFAPGTVLFRGPNYWEGLPPPTADSALVSIGGVLQWSTQAIGGSGGGVLAAQLPTSTSDSTAANATKGSVIVPRRSFAVQGFLAVTRGISSQQNQQRVIVAKVSGTGTGLTIDEVVARSQLQTVNIVSITANRFILDNPIDLEAGQRYLIAIAGDYSTGATALNIRFFTGLEGTMFYAVPAEIEYGGFTFARTNLNASDQADTAGTGTYIIAPIPAD